MSEYEVDKNKTFQSFDTSCSHLSESQKSNLLDVYNIARRFSELRKGWLYLEGCPGTGKTHLACAIANDFLNTLPDADRNELEVLIYQSVPLLLDRLQSNKDDSTINVLLNLPLLILDNLGMQANTSWRTEKLFQILDYRYVKHLPTVVINNQNRLFLERHIYSRLTDTDLVTSILLDLPDYRNGGDAYTSSMHKYADKTFKTFQQRENEGFQGNRTRNLQRAIETAQTFARKPNNWLVFASLEHGNGKTHLAAAIGNYQVALGNSVHFYVMSDLLDILRFSYDASNMYTFYQTLDEIRNCQLLILDDLVTQNWSAWATEKMIQILDHRYVMNLPTVITTTEGLNEIQPQVFSRMLDGTATIFIIEVPAYRGNIRTRNKK